MTKAEYMRRWRKANRPQLRAYNRAWRSRNRERVRQHDNAWREAQGEAWTARKREYDRQNNATINANRRRRYHARKHIPKAIQVRLKEALQARIKQALKQRKASVRTMAILGCSIPDFMLYLESRFKPDMSWENYAQVWEMDHIIPCALFDLTNPEHVRACFHFSNVQPLFVHQNRSKRDKIL